MEDFVVDLKAGRKQQLLARNSNFMITQNETTGTPVWSGNWDYWCISGMWWWLPSMLRSPIHSPTKQPQGRTPFIWTHAKGVESGQNQAMPQWVLQSVQCLHLYTWLSLSTTHGPWTSNWQPCPPMILCATAMHTEKEIYPSRGCPSWKRYTKVHSGARTSNCEQRWDLQPRTSHRVFTESCLASNFTIKQPWSRANIPRDRSWFTQLGLWGERRKILTFQQHSPSMYTENNHRAFFQDWKTVREKNPSLLVVLLTGRSWIRGISTVEVTNREVETPAVGSQGGKEFAVWANKRRMKRRTSKQVLTNTVRQQDWCSGQKKRSILSNRQESPNCL